MSAVIPLVSDSAEMRIVGSFRLAQAIHDVMTKLGSERDVCAYLLELLPALLDADAMSIELTRDTSLTLCRAPVTFFDNTTRGHQPAEEVVTPLTAQGKTIGRICLYYAHESAEVGPQGVALLDFVGSCFARIVVERKGGESRLSTLTPAERKVLSLFTLPTNEILETLHISHETFRVHCKHLYKKLGVHSRKDAVMIARKAGLLIASASSESG